MCDVFDSESSNVGNRSYDLVIIALSIRVLALPQYKLQVPPTTIDINLPLVFYYTTTLILHKILTTYKNRTKKLYLYEYKKLHTPNDATTYQRNPQFQGRRFPFGLNRTLTFPLLADGTLQFSDLLKNHRNKQMGHVEDV